MGRSLPRYDEKEEGCGDEGLSEGRITCLLCERPIGTRVQYHHPVPKSKKGRFTVPVHPICHQAIHANFTNAELARMGEDRDALIANDAIARFLRWIATKSPDFHAPTRK